MSETITNDEMNIINSKREQYLKELEYNTNECVEVCKKVLNYVKNNMDTLTLDGIKSRTRIISVIASSLQDSIKEMDDNIN